MSIKKINEFPVASGVNLTPDDIFLMMDDPSGAAATKKVSLSTLSTFLGNGSGGAGDRLIKDDQEVVLGSNGYLTLPSGSILSETNNTLSLMPPTAASGQSLVIRPTTATWSLTSSGYIVYGSPITISVTLQSWAYFGTVNYTISGTGVTPQSLGRALTGKLTFVSTSAPDTETITWTIPANSNISEFTLTLTSVDGTKSTDEQTQNDPALYYDFEENGMPTGQFITVTNNGISNSEHSHVHLVAGNPSTVDIYLGDDDQYIKIEKDGGDVVIGTDNNNNQWTFDNTGGLTLPNGTNIDTPSGQSRTDAIAITNATELLIETNSEINPNLWTFGIDGSTILPENTLKGYCFTATNAVTNYLPQAASFLYTDNPILRLILTIGGAWYIKGPGLIGWKQISAAQDNGGVALILRIGSGNTPLPDGSEFPAGGGNVYTISQYVEFDLKVADKTWIFKKDGKLTLPIDGDILDSNGTSVLGGGSTTVVSSSYSSTINTDAGAGDIFDITLTGNTTLSNPTNPVNGKTLRWRITQDSTGNRTVTLGNKFNIPGSATSPLPFSTTANKMDILAATYHAGRDKWDIVAFVPGY